LGELSTLIFHDYLNDWSLYDAAEGKKPAMFYFHLKYIIIFIDR